MSSDKNIQQPEIQQPEEDQPSKGPNLVLIYCLVGVAMLGAMAVAALIVLPFYRHR